MRFKPWVLLLLVAAFGSSSLAAVSQTPGFAPPGAREQDKALQRRLDRAARLALGNTQLAGLSVAVSRGGTLQAAKGYGFTDLERRIRARPDTIYRTGSVGKQFTAAALLRLTEQDKLSLEEPIGKYLPRFPRRLQAITIRQLLDHTAGLREVTGIPSFARSQGVGMTIDEVLALIAQQPLEFRPGTGYSYSNSGYLVAGAVIRAVTGRPAAEYMVQENLRPLGLADTSDCSPAPTRRWARGYNPQDPGGWSRAVRLGRFPTLGHAVPVNTTIISSAGGFCSTPVDLIRWTDALHTGGFLAADSLRELTAPAALPDGSRTSYGLGTQIRKFGEHRAFGHAGTISGFQAAAAFFPDDDLSAALMMNTLLPEHEAVRVWREILGAVFDEGPSEWSDFEDGTTTGRGA